MKFQSRMAVDLIDKMHAKLYSLDPILFTRFHIKHQVCVVISRSLLLVGSFQTALERRVFPVTMSM